MKCGIKGCGLIASGKVARFNRDGFLHLCEGHYVRWTTASVAFVKELDKVARNRARVPANGDVQVITERVDRLGARMRGSKIAGRRPQPGTAKAIASRGNNDRDKRRVARRRP